MIYKAILSIFVLCFYSLAFAEDIAPQAKNNQDAFQDVLTKSIEEAIKKAIKDVENEKTKEKEAVASELKEKLVPAISDWVLRVRADKTKELNKLQHRDWSELKKFPSPLPHDYYLKNFNYTIVKSDIALTDSVVNPYKAFVTIEERLYLERYHSSDAAYLEQYRYTAIAPIDLQLEYRDNKFVITETKYGQVVMERGWPK